MATFALIHGAGDVGWYWHLVETELRQQGHAVVAPDLPCDDDSAGLDQYVDTVPMPSVTTTTWSWLASRTAGSPPRWWPIALHADD